MYDYTLKYWDPRYLQIFSWYVYLRSIPNVCIKPLEIISTNTTLAKGLAWLLKTLLGVEAVAKLGLFIYIDMTEDSKSKLMIWELKWSWQPRAAAVFSLDTEGPATCSAVDASPNLGPLGIVDWWVWKLKCDFSDYILGVSQWSTELYLWPLLSTKQPYSGECLLGSKGSLL